MDFNKLYVELIAGREYRINFGNRDEADSFRNSLRVFIYRQNKKLLSLGMGDGICNNSLSFKMLDTEKLTFCISFKPRQKKTWNYTLEEVSKEPKEPEQKE